MKKIQIILFRDKKYGWEKRYNQCFSGKEKYIQRKKRRIHFTVYLNLVFVIQMHVMNAVGEIKAMQIFELVIIGEVDSRETHPVLIW